MDRNQAKALLPIIQAFSEGRKIMVKDRRLSDEEYNWSEVDDCSFNIKQFEYRIKPKSTYRPFKNAEECWQEMQKHKPFGWVKVGDWYCTMREIRPTSAFCHGSGDVFHYEDMVKQITFADGTPFGVKEEE